MIIHIYIVRKYSDEYTTFNDSQIAVPTISFNKTELAIGINEELEFSINEIEPPYDISEELQNDLFPDNITVDGSHYAEM